MSVLAPFDSLMQIIGWPLEKLLNVSANMKNEASPVKLPSLPTFMDLAHSCFLRQAPSSASIAGKLTSMPWQRDAAVARSHSLDVLSNPFAAKG